MTLSTHSCSAVGCQRQVPAHLLMCMEHWRMVPAVEQRAVMATWRQWLRRRDGQAASAYHEAKDKAVAAVATKQQNRSAQRAAASGDLFAPADPAELHSKTNSNVRTK